MLAVLSWPDEAAEFPTIEAAECTFNSHIGSLAGALAAAASQSGPLRERAALVVGDVRVLGSMNEQIVEGARARWGQERRLSIRVQAAIKADRDLTGLSPKTMERLGATVESFARARLGGRRPAEYNVACEQEAISLPATTQAAEPSATPSPANQHTNAKKPSGKVRVGALILKGGGVKGLAFAGALTVLEKYYEFELNAGASAGAIVALLRGAGYTSSELISLLGRTDFQDFLDSPPWWAPVRLLYRGGLHSGNAFRQWMRERLNDKIRRLNAIAMRDIPTRTIVFASSGGTLHFDSHGENCDVAADFAARCSMAIPFFFDSVRHNDERVVDGGVLNNFPIRAVHEVVDGLADDFIALYLGSNRLPPLKSKWLPVELLSLWLGQDERALVDKYQDHIVVIDTRPVHTVQFSLNDVHKQFLEAVGRAAALDFVVQRGLADQDDRLSVATEHAKILDLRRQLIGAETLRRKKARSRLLLLCAILVVLAGAWVYRPAL